MSVVTESSVSFFTEVHMCNWMKLARASFFALVLAIMGTSMACNTMEGAGKDVEKGGEKIQDAAD